MGVSPQSVVVSLDDKAMLQGNDQSCIANGSLWRRWQGKRQRVKSKRQGRIVMKRTACLGSRNAIGRRVRTLKRLIPNGESMGLDGLFRETADYILSLQMRVRAMQIMVDVLSNSDE